MDLEGVEDECGVCGGDGMADGACDCDGNVDDECGVCGGDGSECTGETSFIDVLYASEADIYGFQFAVDGVEVLGVGGGAAEEAGFTTSTGNNTVLGFSFSGTFIPAGSGILTTLTVDDTGEVCIGSTVISGAGGSSLLNDSGDCVTIDDACDDEDSDGICDDVDDCVGEYDECGVCGGGGIADGACDCDGNVEDCFGVCGGE